MPQRHGGFIAIEKNCYHDIGGHEAIKDSLVDDMALARRVKEKGFPFTLASIHPFVYMRMYESGQEVWKGYRKNLFPGVNRSIALLSSVFCLYTLLYLAPVICLMMAFFAAGCAQYMLSHSLLRAGCVDQSGN